MLGLNPRLRALYHQCIRLHLPGLLLGLSIFRHPQVHFAYSVALELVGYQVGIGLGALALPGFSLILSIFRSVRSSRLARFLPVLTSKLQASGYYDKNKSWSVDKRENLAH